MQLIWQRFKKFCEKHKNGTKKCNIKEKSPKIFGTLKNTSYLCSVKGTYLRWEPRLVRQATHKIEALFNSASDG